MTKKTWYILLVIVLWLMMSFAVHSVVLIKTGYRLPGDDRLCARFFAFPRFVQVSILVIGILCGYFIGQRRWRIVYVDHRHRRDCWEKRNPARGC